MVLMAINTLRKITDDYEVIVINDGSRDYTGDILKELEGREEKLRVIDHVQNKGYGAALITGFRTCKKDLIFYTDGDAQYDVRELPALLEQLTDDVSWVNGYKISRSDPLHRKIIGRIYHWIVRIWFGVKLRDVDCDFRLIRRSVFEKIQLKSSSGVICVEMIKKFQAAGFRVAEVPVHHYFRAYGKSQFFNFPRLYRTAIDIFRLWYKLVIKKAYDF